MPRLAPMSGLRRVYPLGHGVRRVRLAGSCRGSLNSHPGSRPPATVPNSRRETTSCTRNHAARGVESHDLVDGSVSGLSGLFAWGGVWSIWRVRLISALLAGQGVVVISSPAESNRSRVSSLRRIVMRCPCQAFPRMNT
ncbi:hypothetical protein FM104_00665 [Microbacterium esteraromaticum]|uniref:Uncharacterized protein n=1 Tax=Microbacterium esteraromaticum TaxID=57043 RepID=A0A1R4I7Q4_9MICO|nr:hypothetical protein FM104_00665 [Microbacterium esteraromaticum]